MKNFTWTTSTSLIFLGVILQLSSLLNLFYVKHYVVAAFMMIGAFCNFADAIRRRNTEKK